MFYSSSPDTYTKAELRQKLFPVANGAGSRYLLESPLRLQIISMNPASDEHYYTVSSLEPDLSVYISMSRQESEVLLDSRLHHHDFYELLFILEGKVFQKIENQRHLYTAGSCCLLNRNVRHSEEYLSENGPFRILFLQISQSFLKLLHDLFRLRLFQAERSDPPTDLEQFLQLNVLSDTLTDKDYVDFIPREASSCGSRSVHALFDKLSAELLLPEEGSSFRAVAIVSEILKLLASRRHYTTTPIRIGTPRENLLFEEIDTCIRASHGRISRSELSERLHYSGSHMNHIVQKMTGLSITDYGLSICMKEVAELLRSTSTPIQEIARIMQFSNRTFFYRKFEEFYHLTPVQYRRQMSQGDRFPDSFESGGAGSLTHLP